MLSEATRTGGMVRRPNRGRLAAFLMMFVLGGVLTTARCIQPPKTLPGRDAAAPKKKDQEPKAPSPEEKLDAKVLGRVAPLKGVARVHLIALEGPLDGKLLAKLTQGLAKVPAGEAVVLEVDAAGGTPAAAAKALKVISEAKPFVITWVRGSATGEAAILPLASAVVALAPGARWGALGASQFTGVRLTEAKHQKLAALFATAARRNKRQAVWARSMVLTGGSVKPAAMKAPAMKAPAMKPAAMKAPALKAPAMKPAAMKPVSASEPPPDRLVTLSALAARQRGLADVVAKDVGGLLHLLGLSKAEVLRGSKSVRSQVAAVAGTKHPRFDPKKLVAGTQRIVVVDIKGMVDLGMLSFVQRTIGRTKSSDLVIIDVDTLGGRVDAAIRIRDALLQAKGKTLAYIHPRAISAGALISLACDVMIMAPGGSIGAATPITVSGGKASPVGEKYVSYMRKEMKSTAEAKGRRGDLAEAMVDMSIEVKNVPPELKESISGLKKGKLLTLTTKEALSLHLVEGTAKSFDDLVGQLGLSGVPVVRPTENWAEKLARFLINPALGGILMILGMVLFYIEARSPGFGAAGIAGLLCFAVVLFGHKIAGLGGWEPALIFGLGVVLLAVEIFVTPGFGLLGGLGIIAVLTSLVWAIIGAGGIPLSVSWDLGYVTSALTRVFGAVVVTAVLGALLAWLLPKAPGPFRKLVLSATSAGDASGGAHDLPEGMENKQDLVGRLGVTETALRPTGKARIEGTRLEVESRGGFVKKGEPVKVIEVVGRRIVVKKESA
jgi:membrane-bound serine protease (ClpP class)